MEVKITSLEMCDNTKVWRANCECGRFSIADGCGPEVHRRAKAHLMVAHGGGVILAPNYTMEVK